MMLGPSWPAVSVQSSSLSEHITQLKHKATQLQAFVNSKIKKDKFKKIFQWIYIEFFVRSVQNFVKRVLNQFKTAQIAADLKALQWIMNTVQHNITVIKNILEVLISRNFALQFFIITEYRHTHIWA